MENRKPGQARNEFRCEQVAIEVAGEEARSGLSYQTREQFITTREF